MLYVGIETAYLFDAFLTVDYVQKAKQRCNWYSVTEVLIYCFIQANLAYKARKGQ